MQRKNFIASLGTLALSGFIGNKINVGFLYDSKENTLILLLLKRVAWQGDEPKKIEKIICTVEKM